MQFYCPRCERLRPTRVLTPTAVGQPSAQRWFDEDHRDIQWYRRCRECQLCGLKFLTAEIEEFLLEELAQLRDMAAQHQARKVKQIRRRCPWLNPKESIPEKIAAGLVANAAWWLTHNSGFPVRARGHASRLQELRHGWEVTFGANKFLVGEALSDCRSKLNSFMDSAATGRLLKLSEVRRALHSPFTWAVANYAGDMYEGEYPATDGRMIFGATAIDLDDAVGFVLRATDATGLFLDDLS